MAQSWLWSSQIAVKKQKIKIISVDRRGADLGSQATFCGSQKIIAWNFFDLTSDKTVSCWKSVIREVKQTPKSTTGTLVRKTLRPRNLWS